MLGIGGHPERSPLYAQQVIFAQNPQHTLVVHPHAAPPQLARDPPIPVAPSMLDGNALHRRSRLHLFLHRCPLLQRTIKTRAAHSRQLTHALDASAALQRHHFLDFVVDTFSPVIPLCRRRASTFCKAPLKKSSSSVFSASTRCNWLISLRSADSRAFPGGDSSSLSSAFIRSRHWYNSRRGTPNSCDNATMLSQLLSRSTAIRRNCFVCRRDRFLATCSPLSLQSVPVPFVSK